MENNNKKKKRVYIYKMCVYNIQNRQRRGDGDDGENARRGMKMRAAGRRARCCDRSGRLRRQARRGTGGWKDGTPEGEKKKKKKNFPGSKKYRG